MTGGTKCDGSMPTGMDGCIWPTPACAIMSIEAAMPTGGTGTTGTDGADTPVAMGAGGASFDKSMPVSCTLLGSGCWLLAG